MSFYDKLKFDSNGLIPAIIQEQGTGRVLMMAWMNREALEATLTSGDVTYWSRSRNELWVKGLTSGHTQRLVSAHYDCDGDAIVLKVNQVGAACHTGEQSCFFSELPSESGAL